MRLDRPRTDKREDCSSTGTPTKLSCLLTDHRSLTKPSSALALQSASSITELTANFGGRDSAANYSWLSFSRTSNGLENVFEIDRVRDRERKIGYSQVGNRWGKVINFSKFFHPPPPPPELIRTRRLSIFKKKILIRTFLLLTCCIFNSFYAKTPL